MKEREIQKRILVRLSKEFHPHGFFWTVDTGVAKSMDGKRTIRFGLPGQPDIQGMLDGRWIGIEVKKPGGRQSEKQKKFQKAVERAGGVYLLVDDVEEAIRALKSARAKWS